MALLFFFRWPAALCAYHSSALAIPTPLSKALITYFSRTSRSVISHILFSPRPGATFLSKPLCVHRSCSNLSFEVLLTTDTRSITSTETQSCYLLLLNGYPIIECHQHKVKLHTRSVLGMTDSCTSETEYNTRTTHRPKGRMAHLLFWQLSTLLQRAFKSQKRVYSHLLVLQK